MSGFFSKNVWELGSQVPDFSHAHKWRQHQKWDDLKNIDDLRNEDNPKNEDNLYNKDNIKTHKKKLRHKMDIIFKKMVCVNKINKGQKTTSTFKIPRIYSVMICKRVKSFC